MEAADELPAKARAKEEREPACPRKSRSPQSYENEALVLDLMPSLLEPHGFAAVATLRQGGMKFIDAKAVDGSDVRFWLKQGWTDSVNYSAIQFGLFNEPGASAFPNSHFTQFVEARVASARSKGATHALLVHMTNGQISNYVALEVDDVAEAYRRQIAHWPKKARNTKTPTLWFEEACLMTAAEWLSRRCCRTCDLSIF